MDYLKRQIQEIQESRTLRFFGVALAATHLLTLLFWLLSKNLFLLSTPASEALCWPTFPQCAKLHDAPISLLYIWAIVYFIFSFFSAIQFVRNKIQSAYFLLMGASLLKLLFFLSDYRFMGNYHYMPLLVSLAYFFLPHKRAWIPLQICLFYFFSVTLKFNQDWLSGNALLNPPWVQGPMLSWLLKYAIFTELIVVWGLLAKNRFLFALSLLHFILFHIFSFPVVSFFFPSIMACLLSIFVFARFEPQKNKRPALIFVYAFLFSLAQIPPLVFSPDAAVTGEGRAYSLNMLDGKVLCEQFSFAKFPQKTIELSRQRYDLAQRIRCDPLVFWNMAKQDCEKLKRQPDFQDLDLWLLSRRSTRSTGYFEVIHRKNFCAESPSMHSWLPNKWIQLKAQNSRSPIALATAPRTATPPFSNFRTNPERNGESPWSEKIKLRFHWRLNNGNAGIHGASKASPSVDASGVYVGGDTGLFYAYDLEGKKRWQFSVSEALAGIHSTAALDANSVYLTAYNGRVYKLDKQTGQLEWAIRLGHAIGASPLLHDGNLYINVERSKPADGFLAKVDATTGTLIWTSPRFGEQSHSSPALDVKSGRLFLGANNGSFYAIEESSGRILWEKNLGGAIKSTPLLSEGKLYVSAWSGKLHSLDAHSGDELWSVDLGAKSQSSPSFFPGTDILALGNHAGELLGISAKEKKIIWRLKYQEEALLASALALKKNPSSILIGCKVNQLCEINSSGKILQELALEAPVDGMPVAYGDQIFASERSPGGLVKWGNQAINRRAKINIPKNTQP
jgi:outer membrane protein assembly factor BamB